MDKVQLLSDISNSFNETELKEICFRLQINYEHISGANLPDRARELILYLERRNRLPALVQVVTALRPNLQAAYAAYLAGQGLDTAVPAPTAPLPTPAPTAAPDRRRNPFTAGPMVKQKQMFYGRGPEVRRLQTRLHNRGSCSIVGMRRVGKSSLLYYLGHHTDLAGQPGCLVAHLDLQDGRYHTLPGLIQGVYEAWAAQMDAAAGDLDTADLPGFAQFVSRLHAADYQPVLCLDEFENLIKHPDQFGDNLFDSWRALASSGQIAFVTVSQQPLVDLIEQSDLTSNFHNIFDQTALGLLAPAEARALLQEPAARQGVVFREEDVEYLLDLCGPHPFYLQMAAFQLFDMATVGAVDRAQLRDDFAWAAERHWQGLWRALTPAEQAAFPLVWQEAASPEAERYGLQMTRRGLLLKEANGYKPFSHGFADWVRAARPQPPPPIDPMPPATPTPDVPSETVKPATPEAPTLDKGLLLITVGVTLAVLVVTALVLRDIVGVQNVGSLVLLLVILLPFILVIVGRLAGQDFLAWLRDLLGKK